MTGNGDPEFWAKARAHLVRGHDAKRGAVLRVDAQRGEREHIRLRESVLKELEGTGR